MDLKKSVLEKFIRYTEVDTMSDGDMLPGKHPTTDGQWDLLRLLEKELKELGLGDVVLNENGILMATLPANKAGLPTVGFMAHVDTASDCNGNQVKARVIENYDGKDVTLCQGLVLDTLTNPELLKYKGGTIIVTDGTSLLGSDDKAGVAEIMTAVEYLLQNPAIEHGDVEVIFTPDEETGSGMDYFPLEKLKSKACYTIDGGERFIVECECFNAASMTIHFSGISTHLGSAKNKMVNAVTMAAAFISAMPQAESPEATNERDGYYCPYHIEGGTTDVDLSLVLRDFDYDNLMARVEAMTSLAESIRKLYHAPEIKVQSKVIYRNMFEACQKDPTAVDLLFAAGKDLGMPLESQVIRGGTDGARLAEKGIPCPNIFTGGHNLHSLKEWAALDAMEDAVKLTVQLIRRWAGADR